MCRPRGLSCGGAGPVAGGIRRAGRVDLGSADGGPQARPALEHRRIPRSHSGTPRRVGDPHRAPKGRRPRSAHGRRTRRRATRCSRPARPSHHRSRPSQRLRRAVGPRPPARQRPQRRAGRTGCASRCRADLHQRRPLRHPRRAAAGDRSGCGASPAQPRRAGRLAAAGSDSACAIRCRAGPPVRSLAGCGERCRAARSRLRIRPVAGCSQPAAVPLSRRSRRDVIPAAPRLPRSAGAVWRPGGRAGAGGVGADPPRARPHRPARVRRLFPGGVRHRAVLPQPRHLLPGPRLGRELGGLLRARHHQCRLGRSGAAVRALPVA